MLEIHGVLHPQHLLCSNVGEDLDLVFGKLLHVLLAIWTHSSDAVHGCDLIENFLALFGSGLFECVETEVNSFYDFFVRELTADIRVRCSLNDYNKVSKSYKFYPPDFEEKAY